MRALMPPPVSLSGPAGVRALAGNPAHPLARTAQAPLAPARRLI